MAAGSVRTCGRRCCARSTPVRSRPTRRGRPACSASSPRSSASSSPAPSSASSPTPSTRRSRTCARGRARSSRSGHTLILGWSPQVPRIIGELVIANESEKTRGGGRARRARTRPSMEEVLRERVERHRDARASCAAAATGRRPTTSSGPRSASARSIVVVREDDGDAGVVKAVLAVRAVDLELAGAHVVAELADPDNARTIRAVTDGRVLTVSSDDVVAEVTAQACLQSGLAAVFTDLLDFDGDELYFHAGRRAGRPHLRRRAARLRGVLGRRPHHRRRRGRAEPGAGHHPRRRRPADPGGGGRLRARPVHRVARSRPPRPARATRPPQPHADPHGRLERLRGQGPEGARRVPSARLPHRRRRGHRLRRPGRHRHQGDGPREADGPRRRRRPGRSPRLRRRARRPTR